MFKDAEPTLGDTESEVNSIDAAFATGERETRAVTAKKSVEKPEMTRDLAIIICSLRK